MFLKVGLLTLMGFNTVLTDTTVWLYPRSFFYSWNKWNALEGPLSHNFSVYTNFQHHCESKKFAIGPGESYSIFGASPVGSSVPSPFVHRLTGQLNDTVLTTKCTFAIYGPEGVQLNITVLRQPNYSRILQQCQRERETSFIKLYDGAKITSSSKILGTGLGINFAMEVQLHRHAISTIATLLNVSFENNTKSRTGTSEVKHSEYSAVSFESDISHCVAASGRMNFTISIQINTHSDEELPFFRKYWTYLIIGAFMYAIYSMRKFIWGKLMRLLEILERTFRIIIYYLTCQRCRKPRRQPSVEIDLSALENERLHREPFLVEPEPSPEEDLSEYPPEYALAHRYESSPIPTSTLPVDLKNNSEAPPPTYEDVIR